MTAPDVRRFWHARWVLPLLLGLVLAGCGRRVDLIPRDVLFGYADRYYPTISPDGSRIAYVAPLEGVPNLWLRSRDGKDDRPLTHDKNHGIREYRWTCDPDLLIYFKGRKEGDSVTMVALNVATGKEKVLTPNPEDVGRGVVARMYGISPEKPGWVAVGLNDRDPRSFDLYRIDIRTGERKLIHEGKPDILWWLVDHELEMRGYLLAEDDGGQSMWLLDPRTGKFHMEIDWTIDDDASMPITFSKDGGKLFMYDSRGRNAAALVLYDLAEKTVQTLISDPNYDVRSLIISPVTGEVQAGNVYRDRSSWVVVDSSILYDMDYLERSNPGDLRLYNRSLNDSLWIVGYTNDAGPSSYYLYTRGDSSLALLFYNREELKGLPLAPMKPIQFTSRDSLTIHGYLTRPLKTKGKTPLIVYVHGGPWTRDYWMFNPEVQWFANRGYACLQVNFRGSAGYGKKFLNAGNREWGGKMQDDLTDGVNWAIANDIADPEKVVIFGGSYGGYASLAGATFTPDIYAGAVAIVPFIDLVDYMASIPPYWEAYRTNLDRRVGKVPRYTSGPNKGMPKDSVDWNDEDRREIEFLRSRSPYYHVDNVHIPLLIAQGALDPIARKVVADRFVQMLRDGNHAVDYKVYKDESHGLAKPEDRMDFYSKAELFLAAQLGGRYEP